MPSRTIFTVVLVGAVLWVLFALPLRVQQPCSNPGKYPENSGKASWQDCLHLQGFRKLQKPLATYHTDFTR
jgi:hypothetical protein